MKTKIQTLCILLLTFLGARAGNVISLSSTSGHPGDEVTLTVGLTTTDAVTAAEVIIPLDKQLTYVEGSAALNEERTDGHQLSVGMKDGALRLYVYSLALKPLKGTEGALATFKLKLKKEPADYPLAPQTMLSDAAGNSLATSIEAGKVTLLSPKLSIVTPRIDYGHIPIRSTYTQTLTLQNVGNEPLEVTDVTFTATGFSVNEEISSIQPGETKSLTLTYNPIVRGSIEETVSVTSNAINGVQKANLVADPFSVNELHVVGASGNSDTEVEIALRVNNMESLVGAQCTFILPDALEYVEGSFAPSERASGHTAAANFANGKLTLILYSSKNTTFTGNDGVVATFRLRLNGNSGWYELNPEAVVLSNITVENMTSATEGAGVTIQSPSIYGEEQLKMGITAVTTPATGRYTVSNNGNAPLNISKVTFLAEGFALKTPLPVVIEAWQSKELEVVYTPTKEGDYATTMNIYTNDPENRMKAVAVSGTVYEPNSLTLTGENQADGTYDLTVGLNNYTDIVAAQFDIHWLKGMITSAEALEKTARLNGHSCTVADMGDGMYRVIIFSMTNAAIAEKEGALFTLTYTPEGNLNYRDTQVQIKNVVLSDKGGINYTSESGISSNAAFTGFTLKFVFEGETLSEQFVRTGTAITAPNVQKKEGYSFSGWGEVPAKMPAKDLTFTGNYIINKYNLVYMIDGVEFNKTSVEFGSTITALEVPTKEGYTFSGWSEVPSTMPAKDVTITGTFSVNSYNLVYMVDGVEFNKTSVEFGSTITALEVPTKEGYTFSGWSEIPSTMPAKDVTITGTFSANCYNLVYMVDGVEFNKTSVEFGSTITALEVPTKEGYTFSGWNEVPSTMPAKDVTIEGSYSINTYTITYMVDGEVYATEQITYGSTITLKDAPVKEGYIFSGWSEAPETMPAEDVVIEGTFTVDGIDAVVTNRLVDVYTLQGVMVKRQIPVEEFEQELPVGIYIVNGKKMVIK